uniref:Putative secreted protein n=1 Tax=Anopheles darlingi TaxID=43151 RepID=A0A2M4DQ28_ANODA
MLSSVFLIVSLATSVSSAYRAVVVGPPHSSVGLQLRAVDSSFPAPVSSPVTVAESLLLPPFDDSRLFLSAPSADRMYLPDE